MNIDEKLQVIQARQGGRLGRLLQKDLTALAGSAGPVDRKVIRLREIADKVAAVIAPSTPCRKGCSACCSNPAIISEMDAMLLAEAAGVPLAKPARLFDVTAGPEARQAFFTPYVGVPCSFLGADGACTVYAHRPVVCRAHHSIEDTPAPCDAGGRPAQVELTRIYLAELHMMGPMMLWSDIREFFPPAAAPAA